MFQNCVYILLFYLEFNLVAAKWITSMNKR